jgi:mycoredoxin
VICRLFQEIDRGFNLWSKSLNDLYTVHPSQIVMYTTEHCGDCYRAKAFFDANNIQYTRVGLEGDERATEFVLSLNHGYRTVPTIVFPDGSVLSEPSWEELRQKTSTG